jgi:hypothetical protein
MCHHIWRISMYLIMLYSYIYLIFLSPMENVAKKWFCKKITIESELIFHLCFGDSDVTIAKHTRPNVGVFGDFRSFWSKVK